LGENHDQACRFGLYQLQTAPAKAGCIATQAFLSKCWSSFTSGVSLARCLGTLPVISLRVPYDHIYCYFGKSLNREKFWVGATSFS
jgi:hypothetical protein